ncbi:hypothetical protein T09_8616 [Trichinella sp. T9]|nr:hypothetical protein T09_8616 [Trichinella sp. T9]
MAIRNHVDKYVITKHYHQLMPLSLVTYFWIQIVKGMAKLSQPQALPSGYAPGQIKICICLQAIPQAIYSTIFDLRGFLCKFLIASGPRRRLRLCPKANKNLHIPAGYTESILLHNICLQGDMQIFVSSQATPRALPQVFFSKVLKFTAGNKQKAPSSIPYLPALHLPLLLFPYLLYSA